MDTVNAVSQVIVLPPLPYAQNALEPVISANTSRAAPAR
jgi:superoxide dismutase